MPSGEATEVHAGEPADAPDAGVIDGSPGGPSRTLTTSLAVLAVVFLIAVVILSIVAVNQRDARHRLAGDRDQVEQVASTFARVLLTYDYHRLDDSRTKVLALASGKFRDDYQRQFPALQELITKVHAVQVGRPQEVYVSSVDANGAKAIVVSDIETDGTSGHRTRDNAYVRLTLLKVGGAWKVVDVEDLNFTEAATTSPTTTTPGK